jgi:hypothetical protein
MDTLLLQYKKEAADFNQWEVATVRCRPRLPLLSSSGMYGHFAFTIKKINQWEVVTVRCRSSSIIFFFRDENLGEMDGKDDHHRTKPKTCI